MEDDSEYKKLKGLFFNFVFCVLVCCLFIFHFFRYHFRVLFVGGDVFNGW